MIAKFAFLSISSNVVMKHFPYLRGCRRNVRICHNKILFNEYVGILLTIKIDVIKITTELTIAVFPNSIKPLKFKISGNKINPAAAGDGTP